jgi:hypothetical protein
MTDRPLIDIDDLLDEIGRYLVAVDVFRSLDCEPAWRPELTSQPVGADAQAAEEEHAQSVR